MSLATWKKEFYPTPASKCEKADALAHVLQKYLGTRPAALKRHGVIKKGSTLHYGAAKFFFGCRTCALCKFYHKRGKCSPECPLATKSGDNCDSLFSPWRLWAYTNNLSPMIRALRRAIKKQAAAGEV